MTNEEARKILDSSFVWQKMVDEECEALGMAIKALEQQPCNDCVSRQAVEEMIMAELPERGMWEIEGDKEKETVCDVCVELMQKLSDLPPVTPHPKTGNWIKYGISRCGEQHYQCTLCGYYVNFGKWGEVYAKQFKYCPNCGARMEAENADRD